MSLKSKSFLRIPLPFFLVLISFHSLDAQLIDKTLETKKKRDVRSPLRSILDQSKESESLNQTPAFALDTELQSLEAAIDPASYIVGPGDVFLVNVWASEELSFRLPVTPGGKLVIPTIGALPVDGKTLVEVYEVVRNAASEKYVQSSVTAHLVRLRTFRVHVAGQVMNPGLYEALAVDRVSDVIERADGMTNWGSERAIEVRHPDGTVDLVDLYRYKKLGELEANIILRGGDVVYVPPIQFSEATVRVEGQINRPGIYQLTQNETLTDFLLRVDALNKDADLQGAYVRRQGDGNGGEETIPIFPYLQSLGNGHSDLPLQDGDAVMIPSRQEEVYVVGAVQQPGPYVYYPSLRALDYVGFAGSTEKAKGISKVQLIRKGSSKAERGPLLLVEPGDTVFVPEKQQLGVREVTSVVLSVTQILLAMKAVGVL
ncbi:polysaccharide export protein [bacterium]|nr:polysaccharide export protein [bacterium]